MNWWHAAAVARGLAVREAKEIPLAYFDAITRSPDEAQAAHGQAALDRAIARTLAKYQVEE